MKIMSLSEAKMKLSNLVESVGKLDEEIVITRNGRAAAVLVSHDLYESWKETEAVRTDHELAREIAAGLDDLDKGKGKPRRQEELFG